MDSNNYKMEQLTELKAAIVERFKMNAYVRELERTIKNRAEKFTFEKYKGTVILRGGLQYELFAVKADIYTWVDRIEIDNVRLELIYTIISKIESHEKKALSKAKDKFYTDKQMGYYGGKKKLWIEEYYYIKPELVVNNGINLLIENTKLLREK